MRRTTRNQPTKLRQHQTAQQPTKSGRRRHHARPNAAYRQRGSGGHTNAEAFNAPEVWHEPTARAEICIVEEPAGKGCFHPVTADEVTERIGLLPERFLQDLDVIQFSRMTRKRALFPCYGMQWGTTVYLYPIEESLEETYIKPPKPQLVIDTKMYGGKWTQEGKIRRLSWTRKTIKDFYLNNILIHEIGHINDQRNTSYETRERYANWFAIEYGYRVSRGLRK
ncbi:MAG: hypothetical protein IH899_11445 [Planctomycetes bacterium]|nr:hypothetical protein [Planctomycetota bacterium]